jgi:hypothetical protein
MKPRFSRFIRMAACAAILVSAAAFALAAPSHAPGKSQAQSAARPKIEILDPPEDGFFAKRLSYHGILIKAPSVVVDDALYAAYDRLALETAHLPQVVANLAAAGAELRIIGRNQVTTDLPEWRQDKHVPLDEYNGLTRDQRTRGMGGLRTSCGEENLLQLPNDRYRGRDICLHEFAHNIEGSGIPRDVRALFDNQFQVSKSKGLWLNSYAGSNPNEYFAELTMWYFGTHGDLNMTGPKPENGPQGLKKYDPEAFKLFDAFYSGRIEIAAVDPRFPPGMLGSFRRTPRDSLLARAIVAKLSAYQVGVTKLAEFLADAGMTAPSDPGANGWRITLQQPAPSDAAGATAVYHFQVFFRKPESPDPPPASPIPAANSSAQTATQPAPPRRPTIDRLLADLEFTRGVLSSFNWDN